MIVAMATVLSTIFLLDIYALIISIVAWSIMYCIKSYDFLKTRTLALIINSPVKGLRALCSAPFMALTATASSTTQQTIFESLYLKNPHVVTLCLDRPNIFSSIAEKCGINVSTYCINTVLAYIGSSLNGRKTSKV